MGTVMRNTEPHQNWPRSHPPRMGPRTDVPVPTPVHRAMARVFDGPDHSDVMSDSVVG